MGSTTLIALSPSIIFSSLGSVNLGTVHTTHHFACYQVAPKRTDAYQHMVGFYQDIVAEGSNVMEKNYSEIGRELSSIARSILCGPLILKPLRRED